jgi:hypothetical protein
MKFCPGVILADPWHCYCPLASRKSSRQEQV